MSNHNPFPTSDSMSGHSAAGDYGESTGHGAGKASEFMERVVQGAHKAVDRMAERAAPTVEDLERRFDEGVHRAQSERDRIASMQDEWLVRTRDCVREHPIASVGVAVLAGMLLSKILGDR